MKIKIKSNSSQPVDLLESNEEKSIAQNVAVLLNTKKGTVPMYRDFGIPMEYIDKPSNVAEAILVAEITDALAEYEPRATLDDVSVEYDETGKMIVTVEVKI